MNKALPLLLISLIFTACTKADKQVQSASGGLPPLELGEPGKTEAEGQLNAKDSNVILEDDEEILFIDDHGLVEIKHRDGRKFRAGDVILGNKGQRIMLKVKEVRVSERNRSEILTKLGQLPDLLVQGKETRVRIETTPKLLPEDVSGSSEMKVDEEGRLILKNLEIFHLEFNPDGKLKAGMNKALGVPIANDSDTLTVSSAAGGTYRAVINEAVIHIIPTFRNHYRWTGFQPDELDSRIDALMKYKMDVTYEVAGEAQFEILLDLLKKKTIPVRIPGPPPVYVDIELSIPLGISIQAQAKGKIRVVYEAEYGFASKLTYTPADGVKVESKQGAQVLRNEVQTEGAITLSGELFLQPQVEARFYRVLGPNTYLQPYVRAEWQSPAPPDKHDLFVGVGGGVGLQVSEPFFLENMLELDSGRIFDFQKSWDLSSNEGGQAPAFPDLVLADQTKVDQLTKEGFVQVNLRTSTLPLGTRFLLLEGPKVGHLVPSRGFPADGKLYYYPSDQGEKDAIRVAILNPSGERREHTIHLEISEKVREQAGADRFSQSGDSVRAAYSSPQQVAGSVPKHQITSGGIALGRPHEFQKHALNYLETENLQALFGTAWPRMEMQAFDLDRHMKLIKEPMRAREGRSTDLFQYLTIVGFPFWTQLGDNEESPTYETSQIDMKLAQVLSRSKEGSRLIGLRLQGMQYTHSLESRPEASLYRLYNLDITEVEIVLPDGSSLFMQRKADDDNYWTIVLPPEITAGVSARIRMSGETFNTKDRSANNRTLTVPVIKIPLDLIEKKIQAKENSYYQ